MALLMRQIAPDPDVELMGLQKEGMSVFPGCSTSMQIPFINGRFNLGLEGTDNKKLKEKFENHFGVKFDSKEGEEWLGKYEIKIDHDITAYDQRNLDCLFDLQVLKSNGGMGIVATSDVAIEESPMNNFKFILVDENAELEDTVKKRAQKFTAITELNTLNNSNTNRMLMIAKYIFDIGSGVGSNKNVAFNKLADYIEKNVKQAEQFLNVMKIDPEYLLTVVKIKEAIYRNIIRYTNGQYVLYATMTPLGRNEEEVIKFCSNPNNKDIVGYGLKDDLPTSISAQLKQYES